MIICNKPKRWVFNSVYGSSGTPYFRFYDLRIAEAVTYAGKYVIQYAAKEINSFMNKLLGTIDKDYIIAMDTDSFFLNMEELVKQSFDDVSDTDKIIDFMQKVADGPIQKELDKIFNVVFEYTNAYEQLMFAKPEKLASTAIFCAKKRNILNVHSDEGVKFTKPKIKITGLEAIKSSTPSACRSKIKACIDIIMNNGNDELIKFVSEFKKEFSSFPVEEISFPKSVNGLTDYKGTNSLYIKGTPINTRGSLIYNNEIQKRNLGNKYPLIQEGEKIKYIYLKEPNPFMSNVIAYTETCPSEFELTKYIDYNIMFEKAFLDPLKIILDAIKWKTEKSNSLMRFRK